MAACAVPGMCDEHERGFGFGLGSRTRIREEVRNAGRRKVSQRGCRNVLSSESEHLRDRLE